MLRLNLVAIWVISTFLLVKVKATTPRGAPMPVELKPFMTVSTRQRTVALCHAYVSKNPCPLESCCIHLLQVFFNAYVLSKNGVPQGLYCSMYNQTWSPDYATNYGQYRGSDRYTVSESYNYINKA